MSGALAIAGVTATLKTCSTRAYSTTTCRRSAASPSPRRPRTASPPVTTKPTSSIIFLYQVTPNLGWRNADLPARDGRGNRIANPPLALDLHYLVTAYGTQDLNAEVLLGYAMQLLHETPVITRAQLRTVLGTPSPVDGTFVPGRFGTLSAEDLADQIELIKIVPNYLSSEELSKLWTAMQARYRPSMAYMGSGRADPGRRRHPRGAAGAEARGADDRGLQAQGAAPPVLEAVRTPGQTPLLPALRLGDDLSLVGSALAQGGTLTALFTNVRLDIVNELPLSAGASANELRSHLPSTAEPRRGFKSDAAAGVILGRRADRQQPASRRWTTKACRSPCVARSAALVCGDGGCDLHCWRACRPRPHPLQESGVRLLFADSALVPTLVEHAGDPTAPAWVFTFLRARTCAGDYLLRLRVDGTESLLMSTRNPSARLFNSYIGPKVNCHMSEQAGWRTNNNHYLAAALAWLRLRLAWKAEVVQAPLVEDCVSPSRRSWFKRAVSKAPTETPVDTRVSEAEVAEAAARIESAEKHAPPPALIMLAQRFGLSRFERHILLLCVAMEFDTRIAALCAWPRAIRRGAIPPSRSRWRCSTIRPGTRCRPDALCATGGCWRSTSRASCP